MINVRDITISRGCRFLMSQSGTTFQSNKVGVYQFDTLTIADGGEVTSTSDVRNLLLTLVMKLGNIQGGGRLHMTNMLIKAENFSVDDLGVVRGDVYDNRSVKSRKIF